MALPTTTASSISLSQIQTEFGGSNPIALSEYVRGGSYVPSGTATGTYGTAIPTTNSNLSMKNYYGTQAAYAVTVTGGLINYFPGNTDQGYVGAGWAYPGTNVPASTNGSLTPSGTTPFGWSIYRFSAAVGTTYGTGRTLIISGHYSKSTIGFETITIGGTTWGTISDGNTTVNNYTVYSTTQYTVVKFPGTVLSPAGSALFIP